MTGLDVFTYADHSVRTVLVDGEPWFVLADVCRVLDLTNPTSVASRVFPDALSTTEVIDSMGREQVARIVSEPGLYAVIFQSRKPEARDFQHWVTHDVLPTIRRTGQYGSALPASFAEALELAASQAREIESKEAELEAARPKVEAYDAFLDAEGYYPMDAAARVLGHGRNTLFRILRDEGILQRGSNLPYRQYDHHFVVTPSTWTDKYGATHSTYTTRVRPSGLDFLRKRLAARATSDA